MGLNLSAFTNTKPTPKASSLNLSAFGITPKPNLVIPSNPTFSEQFKKLTQETAIVRDVLNPKIISPFTEDLQGTGLKKVGGGESGFRDFAVEVGQSIARNIGSAGLSFSTPSPKEVAEPLKAEDFQSFLAQGLFETVFGKDQEIKPIETRIAEAEPKVVEWQKELETLQKTSNLNAREKFVLKTLANLNPKSTAFIGIMGSVGLDLTPFGGLERNAFRAITKVRTIGEGLILGRKMGIADDLLEQFANDAVKVANDTDAEKLFKRTANLQQTTKIAPTTPKTAPETTITPKPLQPLAQDARRLGEIPGGVHSLKKASEFLKNAGFDSSEISQIISDTPQRDALGKLSVITEDLKSSVKIFEDARINPAKQPQVKPISAPEAISKGISKEEWIKGQESSLTKNIGKRFQSSDFEANTLGINMLRRTEKSADISKETVASAKKAIQDGKVEPIIVNRNNEILDGHHRFEAYKQLGQDRVPILRVEGENKYNQPRITNLSSLYDEAVKGKTAISKQLPIPEGLPKIRVEDLPKQRTTEGLQTKKVIKGEVPTKITRMAQERVLLKEKLALEAKAARVGAKEGRKIGGAEAENIAETRQAKAVRDEQLKALKGGIKIRAAKDAIINILKNTTESSERVKSMIVDHIKSALDTADRGKAITLLRDAKTHKDLVKAFSRINRWAEDSIKRGLKNDILKTQKQIMDSPSIAIDYKARVKELMGDFELKGHRESTLERLKKTQEFLQSEAAKGNDVEMPRRILKSLELLNRTPFDEITLNQLTGLKAEMELLENLGRTKFKTTEVVWEIQKSKILEEVSKQGAKPIQNIEIIKPEIGERLTITQKFKNLIWKMGNEAARIDKAISPMDTIFDLLDGGKGTYSGANFRFFKGQVDAGYGRYISRKDVLQEPVIELAEKYKLADTNFERMGVVAAREQDKGTEKLIASGFTEGQVSAIKLTKEEQEVLNKMREVFDSQFPEIQDVMRRVYNQPVEKVKNYFSFMTDWKAMDESEVFERFGSQLPEQFGMPRKNVERGFTISRVGGDQKIKINALDIFLQHTDNTSYLLELGETSKMLGEVAASPQYAEAVGDVGQLMVREWLDVIARKGGASGASEIAILNTLRKNVGAGILGLKLSTIAIQPTALIDGMGFIGVKYGRRGVTNFATNKEWRKFIVNMPEIKDRMGGEFALRELTDDNWSQEIQRKGFIPMQKLDQMTAGSIASGAYEKKMIELGQTIDLTKYNDEALAYAQLAVRRTQSSGAFKDVPLAVSRGALTGNRSLDRAILQFQNFLLTRWSRIRHDAIRAGINTKDPKKAIPIFTAIIISALTASGIRLGVNKIQDFITGKEDEDTVTEDLTKGFMYEMTGNVPFVGTTVSMAMYDGEMFPLLDAPKGIISGLNRVITSKSEGAKLRGLTEFAGSLGATLGIPGSAQAEQLMRGVLQEKKSEPKAKKLKTPIGLPELPSLKKTLPTPLGLPKIPTL